MVFGWKEGLIVLFVVLLLFGAKKLPELARSLGRGVKEFKKGAKEIAEDLEGTGEEDKKKSEEDS